MTPKSQHSPTPLNYEWSAAREAFVVFQDPKNDLDLPFGVIFGKREESKELTAFIVRACNAHEALVKALKLQNEAYENGSSNSLEAYNAIKAALKLAEDK